MEWWKGQPEAWEAARKDLRDPEEAMCAYIAWVKSLPGKPVFVGYPAGFDFLFVYWNMIRFCGPGSSPFSFSALDIKSYAAAVMKCPYRDVSKITMPKHWFEKGANHTHIALDDAIEQGLLFLNMMKDNTNR